MSNKVIFSHGQESGPQGTKINALSEVARSCGYDVESVDYTCTQDPDERVEMLIDYFGARHQNAEKVSDTDKLVLVGSSMGGYVSAVASSTLKPIGLFLMAPAFYIPFYKIPAPEPIAKQTLIVHGWRDDVVPVECSIKYARLYGSTLHLLDGDHRLTSSLSQIEELFADFLLKKVF